jgi:HPt (histidine-containing phosphotransfer) domain-containing protein
MSERRPAASLFSHIFKSPLASIQIASEILVKHLSGKLGPKDQQLLDVIVRNSKTLDLRVSKILEVMQSDESEDTEYSVILALQYDQIEAIHDMNYQKPAPVEPWGQDARIVVRADPEIADLIPRFLENRHKDIVLIMESLQKKDYEAIKTLGHSMKGAGGGYGFPGVTEIGRSIEDAAREMNAERVLVAVDRLTNYLDCVEVIYD